MNEFIYRFMNESEFFMGCIFMGLIVMCLGFIMWVSFKTRLDR